MEGGDPSHDWPSTQSIPSLSMRLVGWWLWEFWSEKPCLFAGQCGVGATVVAKYQTNLIAAASRALNNMVLPLVGVEISLLTFTGRKVSSLGEEIAILAYTRAHKGQTLACAMICSACMCVAGSMLHGLLMPYRADIGMCHDFQFLYLLLSACCMDSCCFPEERSVCHLKLNNGTYCSNCSTCQILRKETAGVAAWARSSKDSLYSSQTCFAVAIKNHELKR
eukprot:1161025-Pelagomonas_calceolata.AAC.3